MEIVKDYNLRDLNTFGITARAKFFAVLENEADIPVLFSSPEFKNSERLFLGGGSNILFTKDFDGIVVLNKILGIEKVEENAEHVWLKVMGGVIWHDVVLFAVEHNYWGIENLSLIPGTVGATPVQNIGAYGTEIKDTIEKVEAYDITTGTKKIFSAPECEFGYRNSVFKNKLKGKYFISAVTMRLSKIPHPNISYKILKNYLTENKIEENLKNISDAVSAIRRAKLPDPKVVGNAGSFFKNVFVEKEKAKKLLEAYPTIPLFEDENAIKVPAGWLIEHCDLKGKRFGTVGIHPMQALVLVNYGGATGAEVQNLANTVIDTVEEKFGLTLEPEVNIV